MVYPPEHRSWFHKRTAFSHLINIHSYTMMSVSLTYKSLWSSGLHTRLPPRRSGFNSPMELLHFFHFFQTLGAKKGHTRHVLPCLLYTTELCIIQRSFWHRSDSYAMICKILTLVREIRHFWRYFMSFSYFLPSQNFCSAIRASYPI